MDYSLIQFCGMQGWVAKQTMQPFEFLELYFNPICIAVLPVIDRDDPGDQETKKLYHKMLAVLELQPHQLLRATMSYNLETQFSSVEQQQVLTKQLLYFQPKAILTFGDLDFLDINLLNMQQVAVYNTFHPEHLLKNVVDKRRAHQDLLLCKQQLANRL